jgi:hypothetical protein
VTALTAVVGVEPSSARETVPPVVVPITSSRPPV